MKKKRPAQRSPRDRLLIAQAQLRAISKLVRQIGTQPPRPIVVEGPNGPVYALADGNPERFIQIIAVGRGYASILHALDAQGQVWQHVAVLGEKVTGQAREVKDSWWEKVEMKRR